MWLICTYPHLMPYYLINEFGNAFSMLTKKDLHPYQTKNGYWYYRMLSDDGKIHNYAVHRLVAWEFCPKCSNLYLDINIMYHKPDKFLQKQPSHIHNIYNIFLYSYIY